MRFTLAWINSCDDIFDIYFGNERNCLVKSRILKTKSLC